jgi:hypothetical protein
LFAPLIAAGLAAVVSRHIWLAAPAGWRHWVFHVGTGSATLVLTWWIARTCRNRIARSGTALATKGVFS